MFFPSNDETKKCVHVPSFPPNFVSPASTYASLMPGGSPTGLSGAHNKNTRSMKHVDKKFKQGKLIYKGMDKKIGKQKWCLNGPRSARDFFFSKLFITFRPLVDHMFWEGPKQFLYHFSLII